MICKTTLNKFCCDDITKIENYEQAINDDTQTWVCHHRLELNNEGKYQHSSKELQDMGLYFNRPHEELILLTRSEHQKLHGRSGSPQVMNFMNKGHKALKSKPSWNAGTKGVMKAWNKGKKTSNETKEKQSAAKKGKHWKLVDGKRVWF